jgi:hypothetical protein
MYEIIFLDIDKTKNPMTSKYAPLKSFCITLFKIFAADRTTKMFSPCDKTVKNS